MAAAVDVNETATDDPVDEMCVTDDIIKPVLQEKQTGIKPRLKELKGERKKVCIVCNKRTNCCFRLDVYIETLMVTLIYN